MLSSTTTAVALLALFGHVAAMKVNVPAEFLRLGYTLLRPLGAGGTARIYEGRHNATGQRVALKVSRGDIQNTKEVVDRMQTEWNVGRDLRHPHLVTILDSGLLPDGRAWLAMERLVGHDLLQELDSRGPMAAPRALYVMRQVCEALSVLHRRGTVHRDVKPENIFLIADGAVDHAKLIDLGILALPLDDPARGHKQTGPFILGTPLYLAPEQAQGTGLDGRADIYSVGAVLYHLLTGQPPFDHSDPLTVVSAHVSTAPPLLKVARPDLPEGISSLVARCMSKQPGDRFDYVEDLSLALFEEAEFLAGGDWPLYLEARLPAIPPIGEMAHWIEFGAQLQQLAQAAWPIHRPRSVTVAMEAIDGAGGLLLQAERVSRLRRVSADEQALSSVDTRAQLERRARGLRTAFDRHTEAHQYAERRVQGALDELAEHNAGYARVLDAIRAQWAPNLPEAEIEALCEWQIQADMMLEERQPLVVELITARSGVHALVERRCEFEHQLLQIEGDLNAADLTATQEAATAAQEAQDADDAQMTAERQLEKACLRLLSAYAENLACG